MPNQYNFRSDVTTTETSRYNASRIVKIPTEAVLLEEVPSSFAFDKDDNIEVHFYTIPGNQLILSTVITLTDDIVKSHIVSYNDGTFKNYLRIDVTKLFTDKNLILIPGDYRMVVNFFSNEIGDYNNRILTIDTISESKTEVELSFNNTTSEIIREENIDLAREFVELSFNKSDAVGVAEKIFTSGVKLQDDTEGLTASVVVDNIEVPEINQTYNDTIAKVDRLGIRPIFDIQVNDFLLELFNFIREEIVINGDERIQQDQYQQIITDIVVNKINNLRQTMDTRISIG
jgi:hypothetical protein